MKLKNCCIFTIFQKKYKTQTGGLLFYDSLYFDDNFGQIFWIPEENYKIGSQNIFNFPNFKRNDIFIAASNFKTNLFFSKGQKNPRFLLKKEVASTVKKYSKQWIINTFPIFSQQNSQGKILSFFPKLNGWIQIKSSAQLNNENSVKRRISKILPFNEKFSKDSRPVNLPIGHLVPSFPSLVKSSTNKDSYTNKIVPSYLIISNGRRYPVIAPLSLKNIRSYSGIWNSDQLKSVFSLQFANSVNRLISKTIYKSFRRNPYFLSTQSQVKPNTFLTKDKRYESLFNRQRRLGKVTLFQPAFESRSTKEKFTWFKQFKHYKCKKIFVHHNVFSVVKSHFPFIDPLLLNILPSPKNKSKTSTFLNSLPLNQVDKASNFLFQNTPLQVQKPSYYTEKASLAEENVIFEIKVKPGWVYFPRTQQDLVYFHKQIVKPGFQFIDKIEFDQHVVYLEGISISSSLSAPYKPYFSHVQLIGKNIDLLKKLNLTELFNQVNCYASFKHSKNIQRLASLFFPNNINSKTFSSAVVLPDTVRRQGLFFQFDKSNNDEKKFANLDKTFPPLKSKAFKNVKPQKLRNLNVFLFQLEQTIQLTENILHQATQDDLLKLSEIKLLQREIPDFVRLGLLKEKFRFRSDSILYLKNKNHRYLKLPNSQILNFHKSFMKEFPRKDKSNVLSKITEFRKFEQSLNKKINNIKNINCLNKNFFVPNFFILIRKIKQYSIPKSSQYKKLLSQSNQTLLERPNHFENTSMYYSEILTNFPWFNKQIRTKLFSSFPSNDFQVYFSFRFNAYKQMDLTKEFNLLEVFILVNIPTAFPLKSAKVGLTSNHGFNRIKKKDKSYSRSKYSRNQYIEFRLFRKIDNSSLMLPELKSKTNHFTNTKLVLHSQNYIFANNPLSFINFFSPYEGEMTAIKMDSFGKPSCFFLTDKDKVTFLIRNSVKKNIPCIAVGKLIRYGEQIASNLATSQSGQVIQVDNFKVIVRKAQSILFSSKGVFYVHHGDFVEKNSPLLTLLYQRLKTGDIVQGIPKIEQLFEARYTEKNEVLPDNLHDKLRYFFEKYKKKYTLQDATRKSLEKIQQILVENVQKVYQSQGVFIADKHLEVIIRQMTSKVKIIEGGQSGLLRSELIDLSWIEMVNKGINSQKAEYEPVILGITKATLEMESFLSAASFQQTPRMLARAAIARKTDFLRGLNNNVILGQLIPAGTGFSRSFQPESSKYFTSGKQMKLDNLVSTANKLINKADEPS